MGAPRVHGPCGVNMQSPVGWSSLELRKRHFGGDLVKEAGVVGLPRGNQTLPVQSYGVRLWTRSPFGGGTGRCLGEMLGRRHGRGAGAAPGSATSRGGQTPGGDAPGGSARLSSARLGSDRFSLSS